MTEIANKEVDECVVMYTTILGDPEITVEEGTKVLRWRNGAEVRIKGSSCESAWFPQKKYGIGWFSVRVHGSPTRIAYGCRDEIWFIKPGVLEKQLGKEPIAG